MKGIALITLASIASASAFAPQVSNARVESALPAKKPVKKEQANKSVFQTIFEMDLWAPVSTSNNYGARSKKQLGTGNLSSRSYVPSGLSKSQYESMRKKDSSKKDANYKRNAAKEGKFLDYTKFYLDRGTDFKDDWYSKVTGGHRMAKTKYDWSGEQDLAGAYTASTKGKDSPKKRIIKKRK